MMLEYINNNLSGFWIATGFLLLTVEILLFGFSTIIFLFAGLAAVTTGLLMMTGLLPESWTAGIACFGISTGIISALLWKVLKNMQNKTQTDRKPQSDFVGLEFVLSSDVSTTEPGSYRYSGIDWKVEIDRDSDSNAFEKGQRVSVVSVDVGLLTVKKSD